MILILQVISSIVVLFGFVIAIGVGYSTYHNRKRLPPTNPRTHLKPIRILTKDDATKLKSLAGNSEMKHTIMHEYSELKERLPLTPALQAGNLTEKEIIQKTAVTPQLMQAGHLLERLYERYERIRFGLREVKRDELESFVDDLQVVYGLLYEAR